MQRATWPVDYHDGVKWARYKQILTASLNLVIGIAHTMPIKQITVTGKPEEQISEVMEDTKWR